MPKENLEFFLQRIEIHLIQTHAKVLTWFELDEKRLNFTPNEGKWSILQILEHISLTSHYLLILIEKATKKALKNIQERNLEEELENYSFDLKKMQRIGEHKSFTWIRPEHMEPTGEKSIDEIKSDVINQLKKCLNFIDLLQDGSGLLYQTTMTVDDLGKLNVYEYIFFLSKHAERHLTQIQENNRLFAENSKNK